MSKMRVLMIPVLKKPPLKRAALKRLLVRNLTLGSPHRSGHTKDNYTEQIYIYDVCSGQVFSCAGITLVVCLILEMLGGVA
jgi:hypothetical protein